jgi:hypothetical protein
MSEKYRIMLTRRKANSLNHKTKFLRPSTGGLFEPIKSLSKTTNMTIWGKVAYCVFLLHVNTNGQINFQYMYKGDMGLKAKGT